MDFNGLSCYPEFDNWELGYEDIMAMDAQFSMGDSFEERSSTSSPFGSPERTPSPQLKTMEELLRCGSISLLDGTTYGKALDDFYAAEEVSSVIIPGEGGSADVQLSQLRTLPGFADAIYKEYAEPDPEAGLCYLIICTTKKYSGAQWNWENLGSKKPAKSQKEVVKFRYFKRKDALPFRRNVISRICDENKKPQLRIVHISSTASTPKTERKEKKRPRAAMNKGRGKEEVEEMQAPIEVKQEMPPMRLLNGNFPHAQQAVERNLQVFGSVMAEEMFFRSCDEHDRQQILQLQGSEALKSVLSMEAYQLNDQSGQNRIGFLAEQLAELNPNLVQKDSEGKYEVDPGALIAVVVAALKELEAQRGETDRKLAEQMQKVSIKASKIAPVATVAPEVLRPAILQCLAASTTYVKTVLIAKSCGVTKQEINQVIYPMKKEGLVEQFQTEARWKLASNPKP